MKPYSERHCNSTYYYHADLEVGQYCKFYIKTGEVDVYRIRVNGPWRRHVKTDRFKVVKESPKQGCFDIICKDLLRKQGRYYVKRDGKLFMLERVTSLECDVPVKYKRYDKESIRVLVSECNSDEKYEKSYFFKLTKEIEKWIDANAEALSKEAKQQEIYHALEKKIEVMGRDIDLRVAYTPRGSKYVLRIKQFTIM